MSEILRKLMRTDTNFVADGEVLDKIFTPDELKSMNTGKFDPVEFHAYPIETKPDGLNQQIQDEKKDA